MRSASIAFQGHLRMNDDVINDIRYALRSALLKEDAQKQSTIFFTVIPGEKPKWASAPSESHIKVFGLDRAVSRGTKGFSGKGGEEQLGAWHALGLPDQTATGFKGMGSDFPGPAPWILFMDWFWDFLKANNMNPSPHEGFGDMNVPYNQLAPNQKRQRKYGKVNKPQMAPGEELPSALKSLAKGGTANWPRGFDIEKDVTIIIDSIGNNQDEVTRAFQKRLSATQVPNYMTIIPDTEEHRWFVSFNYETGDKPQEYDERRKNIDAYKYENREKWVNAIRAIADGKTNPAQLAPLVRKWLVAKHGFPRPFHVDVLSPEEFNRALQTVQSANLAELVDFAKEIGEAPPVIGSVVPDRSDRIRQEILMGKRWVQIINRLAEEGGVEPALVEVALADYLTKNGFEDPFEYDISSPAIQSKAIAAVSSLTFDDIRGLLESVQKQVRSLMG